MIPVVAALALAVSSTLAPVSAAPAKPIVGTTCSEFPADNWWHADVRDLPVHARSRQWLSHMSAEVDLHPDFGPSYGDGPKSGCRTRSVDMCESHCRLRACTGRPLTSACHQLSAGNSEHDVTAIGFASATPANGTVRARVSVRATSLRITRR